MFVFGCADSNCIRRYTDVQTHLATGKHKYPHVKLKLFDKAKSCYKNALANGIHQHIGFIKNFTIIRNSEKFRSKFEPGLGFIQSKTT